MNGPWPMTTAREELAVVIAEAYYMHRYEVEISSAWLLVAEAVIAHQRSLVNKTNDSLSQPVVGP